MGKINILDRQTAELIAAGEVVERPASVAKELLENAVDAGSTAIELELRNGGITYLRVTDNGSGILPEDIPKAFISHATSKIASSEDLEHIFTMGFRGEALASVAAVARVELLTAAPGQAGISYKIEGGQEMEQSLAPCNQGTTIVVSDLFYNVPARMKFLKKDATEGAAVLAVCERMALSNPGVSYRVLKEGKQVLKTPGNGKLSDAIYAVYGAAHYRTLIPVAPLAGGIKVSGFVSRPGSEKSSRAMQCTFLNGRYVRSGTCMAALENAYRTLIPKGKYPAAVLLLEMPPETFDINVHPAKLEVRFQNERPVFEAVYTAVKTALSTLTRTQGLAAFPEIDGEPMTLDASAPNAALPSLSQGSQSAYQVRDGQLHISAAQYQRLTGNTPKAVGGSLPDMGSGAFPGEPEIRTPAPSRAKWGGKVSQETVSEIPGWPPMAKPGNSQNPQWEEKSPEGVKSPEGEKSPEGVKPPKKSKPPLEALQSEGALSFGTETRAVPQQTALPQEPLSPPEATAEEPCLAAMPMLGELFDTYILLQGATEMILVDKHAAHERLLYERLKKKGRAFQRQLLLEPLILEAATKEVAALLENRAFLETLGFLIDDFGERSILVRELPLDLPEQLALETLLEIAPRLLLGEPAPESEAYEKILHTMACKSALRGQEKTSRAECAALLEQLDQNPGVLTCPHGRPVLCTLPRTQLERMFGRA